MTEQQPTTTVHNFNQANHYNKKTLGLFLGGMAVYGTSLGLMLNQSNHTVIGLSTIAGFLGLSAIVYGFFRASTPLETERISSHNKHNN